MHSGSDAIAGTIVPTLRYRDVAAAIAWLCGAFGFEKRQVVNAPDGSVRYAELVFGDGMIMVGPVEDSAVGSLMTQPEQAGGAETQICYLFVEDAVAHRARTVAAGAELVLDIGEDGGGRGYSCRDPEGHIWNFGTYNPWQHQLGEPCRDRGIRRIVGGTLRRLALGIGFLAITFAAAVVVAWALALADPRAVAASGGTSAGAEAHLAGKREAVERELRQVREQLRAERAARAGAENAARDAAEQRMQYDRDRARLAMQEEAARLRLAAEGAQRAVQETRAQLALAERSGAEARAGLDAERAARLEAERAGKEAHDLLAEERAGREAAERMNKELHEQLAHDHSKRALAHRRPLARLHARASKGLPFQWP